MFFIFSGFHQNTKPLSKCFFNSTTLFSRQCSAISTQFNWRHQFLKVWSDFNYCFSFGRQFNDFSILQYSLAASWLRFFYCSDTINMTRWRDVLLIDGEKKGDGKRSSHLRLIVWRLSDYLGAFSAQHSLDSTLNQIFAFAISCPYR